MNPFSTSPSEAKALGLYARCAALAWVMQWGWAPGLVLDAAGQMGGKSRGLSKALLDAGLLKAAGWDASAHLKKIYVPTSAGEDFLQERVDNANDFAGRVGYPTLSLPDKIPKFARHIAVHNLFVQLVAVIHLIEGRAVSYTPGAQIKSSAGGKIPDAVVERAGKTDYVEFEYSKKSTAEIEDFVDYYYRALSLDPRKRLYIYFASRSLQSAFNRVWKPGRVVFPYARNEKGQWVKRDVMGTGIEEAPESMRASLQVVTWSGLLGRLAGLAKVQPAKPAQVILEAEPGELLW